MVRLSSSQGPKHIFVKYLGSLTWSLVVQRDPISTGPDFDGDFCTGIIGRGKNFNWKNLDGKKFGREKFGQEKIWTGKIWKGKNFNWEIWT